MIKKLDIFLHDHQVTSTLKYFYINKHAHQKIIILIFVLKIKIPDMRYKPKISHLYRYQVHVLYIDGGLKHWVSFLKPKVAFYNVIKASDHTCCR